MWIALGLYSIALYLASLLAPLAPLPLVYLYRKYGVSRFFAVAASAAILVFALYLGLLSSSYALFLPRLFGYLKAPHATLALYGMYHYLAYVGMAYLLGQAHDQSWSFARLFGRFLQGFAVFAVGLCVLVFVFQGKGIITVMQEELSVFVGEIIKLQQVAEVQRSVDMEFLLARKDDFIRSLAHLVPGIALAWAWMICLMNLGLARGMFSSLALFPKIRPFAEMRIPFYSVWFGIAATAVVFVHLYLMSLGFLVDIAGNILLVLAALYFLEGLSILSFFLRKWALGPFARVGIYSALLLFFQLLAVALLALGFFDMWLDSRRLEKEKHDDGSNLK